MATKKPDKVVTSVHRGDVPAEKIVSKEPTRQRVRLLERAFIDNCLLEKGAVIYYDGPLEKHMEKVGGKNGES